MRKQAVKSRSRRGKPKTNTACALFPTVTDQKFCNCTSRSTNPRCSAIFRCQPDPLRKVFAVSRRTIRSSSSFRSESHRLEVHRPVLIRELDFLALPAALLEQNDAGRRNDCFGHHDRQEDSE